MTAAREAKGMGKAMEVMALQTSEAAKVAKVIARAAMEFVGISSVMVDVPLEIVANLFMLLQTVAGNMVGDDAAIGSWHSDLWHGEEYGNTVKICLHFKRNGNMLAFCWTEFGGTHFEDSDGAVGLFYSVGFC